MGEKVNDNINGTGDYKAGDREGRPYYIGWVITVVIAFLIVIPVRRFCIESYRISTNAMEEALHQGDLYPGKIN